MFSLFTHAILRIACLIVMIHHTGFVNTFAGRKYLNLFRSAVPERFSVLAGRHAGQPVKCTGESALGGKSKGQRDFQIGKIRIYQHVLCGIDSGVDNELPKGHAHLFGK